MHILTEDVLTQLTELLKMITLQQTKVSEQNEKMNKMK